MTNQERRKIVGDRLRKLRGRKTRRDVAFDLDVSPQAVWLWESDQRVPGDGMKVRIADYYRKSVSAIFYKPGRVRQAEDEDDFFEEM